MQDKHLTGKHTQKQKLKHKEVGDMQDKHLIGKQTQKQKQKQTQRARRHARQTLDRKTNTKTKTQRGGRHGRQTPDSITIGWLTLH